MYAFAQLVADHTISPLMHLIIVGSAGPETDALRSLRASLALEDRIVFLSALQDSGLFWLYKMCRLFVIPSATEGFCLPLVEALQLGCRVVCSDIPIFREVGSQGCTYFDLGYRPRANLVKAITKELYSAAPPPFIQNQFLKRTVAQTLVDFYQTVNVTSIAT